MLILGFAESEYSYEASTRQPGVWVYRLPGAGRDVAGSDGAGAETGVDCINFTSDE
jgi:hypothetical protein